MADDLVGWVTLADVRRAWPDAAKINDPRLRELLTAAYELGLEHAPALAPDAVVPQRYREGQMGTARMIWTMYRAQGESLGLEDTALMIPASPALSAQVRQLYRPPGRPVVG